jgi:phage shock protein A
MPDNHSAQSASSAGTGEGNTRVPEGEAEMCFDLVHVPDHLLGKDIPTYPFDSHGSDESQPYALLAMYPALAAELAAERQRHNDEFNRLTDGNKQLENSLQKTTKQLGDVKRRMEMRVTEHSRTSFELRKEKLRVQVNARNIFFTD